MYKLLKYGNTFNFVRISYEKVKTLLILPLYLFPTYTAKAAKMCQSILLIFYASNNTSCKSICG